MILRHSEKSGQRLADTTRSMCKIKYRARTLFIQQTNILRPSREDSSSPYFVHTSSKFSSVRYVIDDRIHAAEKHASVPVCFPSQSSRLSFLRINSIFNGALCVRSEDYSQSTRCICEACSFFNPIESLSVWWLLSGQKKRSAGVREYFSSNIRRWFILLSAY